MRRGVTLIELLLAIAIAGTLAVLALPGISGLHDRLQVEAAARELVGAHHRARFVAVAEQRVTVLELTSVRLTLRAIEAPTDTTPRWDADGPAVLQVQSVGLPRTVSFAPSGVALGVSNATYTLRRGNAVRQVIVSRYGRVRLQ